MGQLVGRIRVDPKFNFTPPGGNAASVVYRSVLTCTTNPVDGDTIDIIYSTSTTTLTFLNSPIADTDIQIGLTATATMTNLAAAMTLIATDTDWVSVFVNASKGAGATVAYILTEASTVTYTGSGVIVQSSIESSSLNVDHRRYVEATVEDADGNSNGMLWVKVVEDISGGGGAISRKIQTKSGTVNTGGVTESIPLNTGGGIIRFIATNGDAPTGVLFICTDGATSGGLPILPRESYEIDASVKSISIRADGTGRPYTLCYLINV